MLCFSFPYITFVKTLILILSSRDHDRRDDHAMRVGMSAAPRKGLWMEFGVLGGHTLGMMARAAPQRTVYAFNSFRGLPERWRSVEYRPALES